MSEVLNPRDFELELFFERLHDDEPRNEDHFALLNTLRKSVTLFGASKEAELKEQGRTTSSNVLNELLNVVLSVSPSDTLDALAELTRTLQLVQNDRTGLQLEVIKCLVGLQLIERHDDGRPVYQALSSPGTPSAVSDARKRYQMLAECIARPDAVVSPTNGCELRLIVREADRLGVPGIVESLRSPPCSPNTRRPSSPLPGGTAMQKLSSLLSEHLKAAARSQFALDVGDPQLPSNVAPSEVVPRVRSLLDGVGRLIEDAVAVFDAAVVPFLTAGSVNNGCSKAFASYASALHRQLAAVMVQLASGPAAESREAILTLVRWVQVGYNPQLARLGVTGLQPPLLDTLEPLYDAYRMSLQDMFKCVVRRIVEQDAASAPITVKDALYTLGPGLLFEDLEAAVKIAEHTRETKFVHLVLVECVRALQSYQHAIATLLQCWAEPKVTLLVATVNNCANASRSVLELKGRFAPAVPQCLRPQLEAMFDTCAAGFLERCTETLHVISTVLSADWRHCFEKLFTNEWHDSDVIHGLLERLVSNDAHYLLQPHFHELVEETARALAHCYADRLLTSYTHSARNVARMREDVDSLLDFFRAELGRPLAAKRLELLTDLFDVMSAEPEMVEIHLMALLKHNGDCSMDIATHLLGIRTDMSEQQRDNALEGCMRVIEHYHDGRTASDGFFAEWLSVYADRLNRRGVLASVLTPVKSKKHKRKLSEASPADRTPVATRTASPASTPSSSGRLVQRGPLSPGAASGVVASSAVALRSPKLPLPVALLAALGVNVARSVSKSSLHSRKSKSARSVGSRSPSGSPAPSPSPASRTPATLSTPSTPATPASTASAASSASSATSAGVSTPITPIPRKLQFATPSPSSSPASAGSTNSARPSNPPSVRETKEQKRARQEAKKALKKEAKAAKKVAEYAAKAEKARLKALQLTGGSVSDSTSDG